MIENSAQEKTANKSNDKTSRLQPFFQLNKWYSITLTPTDKYQFFGKHDRFERFRNFYYENFLSPKFPDYYFIAEVSEPHSNLRPPHAGPRLHFHGIIKFRNRKILENFLLLEYYKLLRHTGVDISILTHGQYWWDYMHKQKVLPKKSKIFTNYDQSYFQGKVLPALLHKHSPSSSSVDNKT